MMLSLLTRRVDGHRCVAFIAARNEFLSALTLTQSNAATAQLWVIGFSNEYVIDWLAIDAAAVLISTSVVCSPSPCSASSSAASLWPQSSDEARAQFACDLTTNTGLTNLYEGLASGSPLAGPGPPATTDRGLLVEQYFPSRHPQEEVANSATMLWPTHAQ
jgi:hypothetical protein